MSEQVTCEQCGQRGKRLIGRVAPEGWHFASFTMGEAGDHDPGDMLIVFACSDACRDAIWTKMNGHTWASIERRVDVISELRRCAANVSLTLRDQARRIVDGSWMDDPSTAAVKFATLLEDAASHLVLAAENEVEALRAEERNRIGAPGGMKASES